MNRLLKSLSFGLLAGAAAVLALWLAGPPRYTSDRVLPAGVRLDGWDDYAAGLRLNAQTQRVEAAMNKPLARPLRLAGVPLDEAIVAFSKAAGVDVAVQWNSFDDTANALKTPITLAVDAGGASAADVLDGLAATRGQYDIAFAWRVQDGGVIVRAVLRVAGEVDVRRRSVVKMYDVSRLVLADLAFDDRRPGSPLNGKTRTESVEDIIQAIQSMILRDSWTENGGNVGAIKEVNGWLIVNQTPKVHAQIGRFLNEYHRRQKLRLGGGPGAAVVNRGGDDLAVSIPAPRQAAGSRAALAGAVRGVRV